MSTNSKYISHYQDPWEIIPKSSHHVLRDFRVLRMSYANVGDLTHLSRHPGTFIERNKLNPLKVLGLMGQGWGVLRGGGAVLAAGRLGSWCLRDGRD